jgi:hypothetical protein
VRPRAQHARHRGCVRLAAGHRSAGYGLGHLSAHRRCAYRSLSRQPGRTRHHRGVVWRPAAHRHHPHRGTKRGAERAGRFCRRRPIWDLDPTESAGRAAGDSRRRARRLPSRPADLGQHPARLPPALVDTRRDRTYRIRPRQRRESGRLRQHLGTDPGSAVGWLTRHGRHHRHRPRSAGRGSGLGPGGGPHAVHPFQLEGLRCRWQRRRSG